MTLVSLAPRIIISNDAGTPSITVPSRKNWLIVFFAIWFVGWTTGGINIGLELLHKPPKDTGGLIFTLVWMCGWLFGEVAVLWVIAWTLTGKEVITLKDSSLVVFFGIAGIGQTHEYNLNNIQNLRVSPEYYYPRKGPKAEGAVAFDYGGRTYRFGLACDEAESEQIVTILRPFIK